MICHHLTNTLRPLSPAHRRAVRDRYHGPNTLDEDSRRQLAQAVWHVMDDLEHAHQVPPRAARIAHEIINLRATYNCLYDDLGENETLPDSHYPDCERVAAIIREKRRAGRTAEAMAQIRPARSNATSTDAVPSDNTSTRHELSREES